MTYTVSSGALNSTPTNQPSAPPPAYATQFAAVHTTMEKLTAQSLLLLGHHTASPESSPHSSVHHWLQTAQPLVPTPSQVEPSLSSNHSELHPPLPLVLMLQ